MNVESMEPGCDRALDLHAHLDDVTALLELDRAQHFISRGPKLRACGRALFRGTAADLASLREICPCSHNHQTDEHHDPGVPHHHVSSFHDGFSHHYALRPCACYSRSKTTGMPL